MSVQVRISDGAIEEARPVDNAEESLKNPGTMQPKENVGAVVLFEGVVRASEAGRPIRGLMYEAYEPMATRLLAELSREIVAKHGLSSIDVSHSRGEVAVGKRSFRLVVQSAHRKEAIAAMDEFIDRLKRDIPIWKTPLWL